MKKILSLLLLCVSLSAFSQTVNISGRCYYDVNGNHVYDGGDSVLANTSVSVYGENNTYPSATNASGIYSVVVVVGSYYIRLTGPVAYDDYKGFEDEHRDYVNAGSDIVDFALQQRDSVEIVNLYINGDGNSLTSNGDTKQYNLTYSYSGLLKSMPASVTLNFNPLLTISNIEPAPAIVSSGKIQWNFLDVRRDNSDLPDTISFSVTYPAVGDTISYFILSPSFIPGIVVTMPQNNYQVNYNFYENIEFPALAPTGATKGVKWLRHFAANSDYENCVSVDTTGNGEELFLAGNRNPAISPTGSNTKPFIAKLNRDGLSIWEKYLDSLPNGEWFDYVTVVKHTVDGGCMVLGDFYESDLSYYNNEVQVARLDSSGKIKWSKKIGGSREESSEQGLLVLQDGSCLVTGYTDSNDGDFINNSDTVKGNLFVTKLSPDGDIIFTKVYGGTEEEIGYKIVQLQNGSFLVLGTTTSNDGDVIGAHTHGIYEVSYSGTDTNYNWEAWVLNIDANGNIIWNKCYGGSGESYITSAINSNGGILLTGTTNSKNGDLAYYPESFVSLWILQISNSGNILWTKEHKVYKGYQDSNYVIGTLDGFYSNNLSSDLHRTKDGNFVLGGIISDKYGAIRSRHGKGDFNLLKINPAGDILWQKAIGGTGDDHINDIAITRNEDIVFAGDSYSDNDDLYQHAESYKQLAVVGKIGITNVIKGQVFIDNNGNHIKDAGERYYSQGRINSVKYADTVAARIFDGKFLNNVDTGNYISSYKAANNYYTVFPASHATAFAGLDLTDSFDFALAPKPNVNDLEVELLPLSTPRPGFDVTYRVITKNVGTTNINNAVIGFKMDNHQTLLEASRPQTGMLADSIWWGPFTLNAFGIDTLLVTVTLDAPPALNNGDTLSISVTANPVLNDSSTANNMAALKEIVRGSFDPNDKTEIHAGVLSTTQYAGGDYLQYMIRFQNTGTDTAFFITVKDTLQSKLDFKSLEVISASHPYTFSMSGNIATWDFKKILLPDSTTDEQGSHGYILFKIKPQTGLTVGDEFSNKAAIYFDYNMPVLTNQEKTSIGDRAGICPNGNASFIAGISGNSYQWQVNPGSGFTNLANTGVYSGVNTATLSLTNLPTTMSGYRYRCVVNGSNYSPEYKLKFAVRWNGAANSNWSNTANWDCGVLPDGQTEVIIGTAPNYPAISSNVYCYSLSLAPGSIVTVATGFKLTITGKVN